METGSRLPTGEYTPLDRASDTHIRFIARYKFVTYLGLYLDTTQLDSAWSVFNFYTKSASSRRELVANSILVGDCLDESDVDADATQLDS